MVVAYLLFWLFSLIIIVSAFSSAGTLSGFAAHRLRSTVHQLRRNP
jgi:hypothetical protein